MSNNNMTAVEWLVEELKKSTNYRGLQNIGITHQELIDQAKEMEKNETIDSAMDMFNHLNNLPYGIEYLSNRDAAQRRTEQYYNENYGE